MCYVVWGCGMWCCSWWQLYQVCDASRARFSPRRAMDADGSIHWASWCGLKRHPFGEHLSPLNWGGLSLAGILLALGCVLAEGTVLENGHLLFHPLGSQVLDDSAPVIDRSIRIIATGSLSSPYTYIKSALRPRTPLTASLDRWKMEEMLDYLIDRYLANQGPHRWIRAGKVLWKEGQWHGVDVVVSRAYRTRRCLLIASTAAVLPQRTIHH